MGDFHREREKPVKMGSVEGGAAYANRNPLFRSPDLDDDYTDDSNESSNSPESRAPSHGQPSRGSRGRERGNRHSQGRPTALKNMDAPNGRDRSLDASGTRRERSRPGPSGSRGSRHALLGSPSTNEDDNPSVSGMVMLSEKNNGGRGGSGGRGLGKNNHGGNGHGVGTANFGSLGGKEPAVKGTGCMTSHTFFKLVTLAVALFNGAYLWSSYDVSSGRLCSFRTKGSCVTETGAKILLTIARLSAGALFPSIIFCVLSKCYATRYFLHHSWLILIVDFEPSHVLHTYYGEVTMYCSVIHSLAHIIRFVYENNTELLFTIPVNRSGVAALVLLLPSVMPMSFAFFKKKMTYEVRKLMHLLFVPFIVAVAFHTAPLRLMGSVLLVWYLLDRLYFTTRMTFYIGRPTFKAVGRGTLVRFDLPTGFKFKPGAYTQVNCPAISASEWHPFSIFPVPGARPRAGFHIEAVGDWTHELFRLCLEDPHMPLWITAAQPSVLEETVYYDNVILVCTGAGITPAVSVAERFAKKKNVHLLWLSREPGMIAMFEKPLRRVKSTVHLTGKPTPKTKKRMVDLLAPARGEVVASTAGTASRPSSRSSSYSDLTMLEEGAGKDDVSTERATDDGDESSAFGGSMMGGSMLGGSMLGGSAWGGSVREDGREDSSNWGHKRRPSRKEVKRSRGLHPVSIVFGRPDVEGFISETIMGTAVIPEWADAGVLPPTKEESPPTRLGQVLARLNTNQRISKRDLMSADLSVVDDKPVKASSVSGNAGSSMLGGTGETAGGQSADPQSWLVLYCGANTRVENAVISSCKKLNVTWRLEYFSAW